MAGRVFLTGGSGFIGGFLKRHLESVGYEVDAPPTLFSESKTLETAFRAVPQWDTVIHLAGMSAYHQCHQNPFEAFATNLGGTAYLADLTVQHSPGAHFIFASTAQVYRPPNEYDASHVIDETWPILPTSTYAKTKMLAENCLRQYSDLYGLKVTTLRLFNHTHKGQGADFFLPHIFSKITDAPKGSRVKIPVGNIDLKRDFGSVFDLVRAFEALLAKGDLLARHNLFNICSGQARSLRDLANLLADRVGIAIDFELDQSRLRVGEPASLRGSYQNLNKAVGWRPEAQSDQDFVNAFLA